MSNNGFKILNFFFLMHHRLNSKISNMRSCFENKCCLTYDNRMEKMKRKQDHCHRVARVTEWLRRLRTVFLLNWICHSWTVSLDFLFVWINWHLFSTFSRTFSDFRLGGMFLLLRLDLLALALIFFWTSAWAGLEVCRRFPYLESDGFRKPFEH